jgi:hypothetical protein
LTDQKPPNSSIPADRADAHRRLRHSVPLQHGACPPHLRLHGIHPRSAIQKTTLEEPGKPSSLSSSRHPQHLRRPPPRRGPACPRLGSPPSPPTSHLHSPTCYARRAPQACRTTCAHCAAIEPPRGPPPPPPTARVIGHVAVAPFVPRTPLPARGRIHGPSRLGGRPLCGAGTSAPAPRKGPGPGPGSGPGHLGG